MTEKEFWNEVWERAGQGAHGHRLADFAVKASKEAGAKFDPEPVELPVLGIHYGTRIPFQLSEPGTGRSLNEVELLEVVRRCNAWPKLRETAFLPEGLVSHNDALGRLRYIAAVLEGRTP